MISNATLHCNRANNAEDITLDTRVAQQHFITFSIIWRFPNQQRGGELKPREERRLTVNVTAAEL